MTATAATLGLWGGAIGRAPRDDGAVREVPMVNVSRAAVGDARIALIQDGTMVLPGDEMFHGFTPEEWARQLPAAREGQFVTPVNAALVQVDGEVILVDTGLGTSTGEGGPGGALLPALAELGLSPDD